MCRLFVILMLAWMPWSGQALAAALVAEQAYHHDAQQALTPEGASHADFSPYAGDLRLGYPTGVGWIRLKIHASQSHPDEALILRVSPYLLDRIELHEKIDGRWQTQLRGDRHPQKMDVCPDDGHCFVLGTSASQAQTVYLRVQNAGLMFVQTNVLAAHELTPSLVKRSRQITVSLSVALGLLFIGLLYTTINFSLLALTYCAYQFSVALFVVSSVGMLGALLPDWAPVQSTRPAACCLPPAWR